MDGTEQCINPSSLSLRCARYVGPELIGPQYYWADAAWPIKLIGRIE